MLEEALGHAYEGLIVTDPNGLIIKINQAYATFLGGMRVEDMIGKHCTEVIENTRMHIVAKTGVPEIAHIQKIHGHEMICSRIPILEHGKVVAVIGKVMFQDIDDLFAMSERFTNLKKEMEFYKAELNKRIGAKYSFDNIVGTSKELEDVKTLARKVAKSDTTVLLQGESGTGKELFAHSIHVESNRALHPFIKLNCAAIPETLFESELFGYKGGAFTGAKKHGKPGKFALADKGTIFLDEVSELPLSMQVKLLRVLQEKEIEPVGGVEPEPIDVRIVAATNKDLESLLEARHVPPGPLLPAERGEARHPPAPGAARRHPAARGADPEAAREGDGYPGGGHRRRRRGGPQGVPVARQRPGAQRPQPLRSPRRDRRGADRTDRSDRS